MEKKIGVLFTLLLLSMLVCACTFPPNGDPVQTDGTGAECTTFATTEPYDVDETKSSDVAESVPTEETLLQTEAPTEGSQGTQETESVMLPTMNEEKDLEETQPTDPETKEDFCPPENTTLDQDAMVGGDGGERQ